MTLPLAIRPRIRLRDEPEPGRARTAWLPPTALPVAVYWVVMGFLTYGVSKSPSWLASESAPPEPHAVDTGPVQQFTRVVAARSEAPPAGSELEAVRDEAPAVRDEMPAVRSTFDEAPMPTKVPETPSHRPLLEPRHPLATAARAPHDVGHTRDARRSRRNRRPAGDALVTAPPSSLAMHGDPVPHDSFAMRDDSALTNFVRAPSDAPPAARTTPRATSNLPGCESAAAAAKNEWDLTAARGAPDLSRDAYATVLENGAYLSHCAVPRGTALDICAAVQNGRPVGITVVAHPADHQVSACVKAAVESLSFPSHPRLDVTRTHFDAVSGR